MRGDKVRVVVDAGAGQVREYVLEATRDGRTVDQARAGTQMVVSERTRNGEPVRQAIFMASRVVAIVEEPRET